MNFQVTVVTSGHSHQLPVVRGELPWHPFPALELKRPPSGADDITTWNKNEAPRHTLLYHLQVLWARTQEGAGAPFRNPGESTTPPGLLRLPLEMVPAFQTQSGQSSILWKRTAGERIGAETSHLARPRSPTMEAADLSFFLQTPTQTGGGILVLSATDPGDSPAHSSPKRDLSILGAVWSEQATPTPRLSKLTPTLAGPGLTEPSSGLTVVAGTGSTCPYSSLTGELSSLTHTHADICPLNRDWALGSRAKPPIRTAPHRPGKQRSKERETP